MGIVDIAMTSTALWLPPVAIFLTANRLRGFLFGVAIVWAMMIFGAQYHLAFTPGYDSFAPALSIVIGWIPAMIYSGFWVGIAMIFTSVTKQSEPS